MMLKIAAFTALLLAASPVLAQDEPTDESETPIGVPGTGLEVSAQLDLMSDYRFRGVSRSDGDPAAQAGLMIRHGSGFYVGARGTTLRGLDRFRLRDPAFGDLGDLQLDLYAGYGTDLGGGFDLGAGVMYYAFTGSEGPTDYVEPFASLSYLIGPVYASAGVKYAPPQAGTGDEDMLYAYGQVDVSVPFTPFSFSAQAGQQDWGRFGRYTNWSLGGAYHLSFPGLPSAELGLRYVDTNLPSAPGQGAGVVASLEISF
jgi:uncharacterized protein (TIGR02001 family)